MAGDLPVDPTKNVLDMVQFERIRLDGLRQADAKLRQAENRRFNDMLSMLHANSERISSMADKRLAELERFRYEQNGKAIGINLIIGAMFTIGNLVIAVLNMKF